MAPVSADTTVSSVRFRKLHHRCRLLHMSQETPSEAFGVPEIYFIFNVLYNYYFEVLEFCLTMARVQFHFQDVSYGMISKCSLWIDNCGSVFGRQ